MIKNTKKPAEKNTAAAKIPKFIHHIADALRAAGHVPEELDLYRADVLAFLSPEEENQIKLAAIRQMWKYEHLRCHPKDVVMSPMPRHYRTTSKRRAFYLRGKFTLEMGYTGEKVAVTVMFWKRNSITVFMPCFSDLLRRRKMKNWQNPSTIAFYAAHIPKLH